MTLIKAYMCITPQRKTNTESDQKQTHVPVTNCNRHHQKYNPNPKPFRKPHTLQMLKSRPAIQAVYMITLALHTNTHIT